MNISVHLGTSNHNKRQRKLYLEAYTIIITYVASCREASSYPEGKMSRDLLYACTYIKIIKTFLSLSLSSTQSICQLGQYQPKINEHYAALTPSRREQLGLHSTLYHCARGTDRD